VNYRLYGLNLASDFPFASPLPSGAGPIDLTVACSPLPLEPGQSPAGELLFASPDRNAAGESLASLHRLPAAERIRFTGTAEFTLAEGGIDCRLQDAGRAAMAEIHLLGTVLAFYLERRGVRVLHGAAVAIGGRSVAFLATNRGGKTSLAAALIQAGGALLSDDLLAIDEREGAFWVRPGYPQVRMWPDAAIHFLGTVAGLEQVLPGIDKRRVPIGAGCFGRFRREPRPLAAIYLPERRPAQEAIRIAPVSRRDAVIHLVRHSYCPRLVAAVGLQAERLALFDRLTAAVPLRRLRYPSGFDQLDRVLAAVLDDLRDG
jgi:hypothetical protein